MKGKLGIAKRFGTRYGAPLKHKLAKIESEQKAPHKCKKCGKITIKRLSYGIWICNHCGLKFAGRAYSPQAPRPVIETISTEVHTARVVEVAKEEENFDEPAEENNG